MTANAPLHDAQAMRHADPEWLSLALMHARNRTLAWLSALEPHAARTISEQLPAWWIAGRAGWFQERWIARHVQRSRGAAADATLPPLASIEPRADGWWAATPAADTEPPSADLLRAYLADTLDATLDLLAASVDDDDALYPFRAALFEEDQAVLGFAALAQAHRAGEVHALLPERVLRPQRAPLGFAAQRWTLGSPRGGFVPAAERWAHEEPVPEFEIDAQPVSWQQYAEFVADGGYDEARWWDDEGAAWLARDGRRVPRDVEQLRHGVLVQRFGRLLQAPAGEAASMLTWHEAAAWCRWAGRRLPTEVEWELAAGRGLSRGFVWGDVPEWTAGRARAWPGGQLVAAAQHRVQRGVTWFEPRRLAHPKARRFRSGDDDRGFAGFRSCAI
jgi:formylglycine-generating enzyme required for sulfatase activity